MIELLKPKGYDELSQSERAKICNGAGAANDWRSAFIPNSIYGLDCTKVFDIHDYAYYIGVTIEDKARADIEMLVNLIRIINHHGGFVAVLRRHRAITYYEAVHNFGEKAFFS